MQRLNVSLTRSKFSLICVGNAATMGKVHKSNDIDGQDGFGKVILSATSELVNEASRRNVIYEREEMVRSMESNDNIPSISSSYAESKKITEEKERMQELRQEKQRLPPPPPIRYEGRVSSYNKYQGNARKPSSNNQRDQSSRNRNLKQRQQEYNGRRY